MVTTTQAQTAQFDKVKNVLYKLREAVLKNEHLKVSSFCQSNGVTHQFVSIVERTGAIKRSEAEMMLGKHNGIFFVWKYRNYANTSEVDNDLVKKFFAAQLEANREATARAKAKKGNVVTSATKLRIEQNPNDVQHQIIFLRGELEKEKLVKGYLRPEYEMYFKTMLKNLETLHALKSMI